MTAPWNVDDTLWLAAELLLPVTAAGNKALRGRTTDLAARGPFVLTTGGTGGKTYPELGGGSDTSRSPGDIAIPWCDLTDHR